MNTINLTDTTKPLVLTRIIDAPRELVFKAWTDTKMLAQWWGPTGFTNPVCEVDAQPGGRWNIHMQAPDGTVYPMGGCYREIVEPERLVVTTVAFFGSDGEPALEVLNTVTFEEDDGKTKLTVRVQVVKAAPEVAGALAGQEMGWSGSLARLVELVEDGQVSEDLSDRQIVTTRLINAPRALVFRAWTEPERIAKWWGPVGFTNTITEMDVRPGGVWQLVMHGPDGTDYPMRNVYIAIVEPERISLVHESAPRFAMTATFEDEGGKTRLTMTQIFESAKQFECAKRFNAVEGAQQTVERLAELVEGGTS